MLVLSKIQINCLMNLNAESMAELIFPLIYHMNYFKKIFFSI